MNLKLLRMTMRVALRSLQRNKLRSALTMLGVIFGVGAVIAMVAIGQGADASIQAQINSLGTNVIIVMPGATTSAGVRSGYGGASTLTVADAAATAGTCGNAASVAAAATCREESNGAGRRRSEERSFEIHLRIVLSGAASAQCA